MMPSINVHINQVALEATGPKRAIVSYTGVKPDLRFYLLDEKGDRVYSGDLESLEAIAEWSPERKYLKAEFSDYVKSGTYRVSVTSSTAGEDGKIVDTIQSANFSIAENALYKKTISALLNYFKKNRHVDEKDRHIRIINTERYVDVWGGWNDAGGDSGKYLSHLTYANFMTPQQASLAVWALSTSYSLASNELENQGQKENLLSEIYWGADYLHRILDPEGYFYLTVFDKWGKPGAERLVTAYKGIEGHYTDNFQAAFREGAGLAIAALARTSSLAEESELHGGLKGEFSGLNYLDDAKRAYAHLKAYNPRYCDDGKENIIDDYTALVAAVELFNVTESEVYLNDARERANNLVARFSKQGWFISDDATRPYFHAAEAGLPLISLISYLAIERDDSYRKPVMSVVLGSMKHQLVLNARVANPFDYARQNFKTYQDGKYSAEVFEGFFIPHENETAYWWQGENARLSSLALAAAMVSRLIKEEGIEDLEEADSLYTFAQSQLDWILGRNPYDMCMLYGFGEKNPPYAESGGAMVIGGISNGITGAVDSAEGRGISFAAGPESNNWRWVEQWIPHSSWFLLAISYMQTECFE